MTHMYHPRFVLNVKELVPQAVISGQLVIGDSSRSLRDPATDQFKSNLSVTSCCWSTEYTDTKKTKTEDKNKKHQTKTR